MEEEKSLELDYQIAREQDGERCNDFYNRTYSTDRSLEGWQWEFATDSKPDDKLPFVFIEGHGDILGTQAYIPITMIDQNGVFATAKSEETLLHPKLRGKNAFANMYEILFAIARQNDVHGIWGFTPAGKAFRRIGFETPSSVTQLLKPRRIGFISRMRAAANEAAKASFLVDTLAGLAALAVSRTVSLFRRKTDLRLSELSEAPDWLDEISRVFLDHWGGVTIHRSKSYCDWRFFRNPHAACRFWAITNSGTPIGFAATSDIDGTIYLVDFMLTSTSDTGSGLSRASLTDVTTALALIEAAAADKQTYGLRTWHGSEHPFSLLVAQGAKRNGWFHYKRGSEIVLWRNSGIGDNRMPSDTSSIYITRAFTEGQMG